MGNITNNLLILRRYYIGILVEDTILLIEDTLLVS